MERRSDRTNRNLTAEEEIVLNTLIAIINDTQMHMITVVAESITPLDVNAIYGYVLHHEIAEIPDSALLSYIERFDRSRFDSELEYYTRSGVFHLDDDRYQLTYTARKFMPVFEETCARRNIGYKNPSLENF